MATEKLNVIPEYDVTPTIPQNDVTPMVPESNPIPVIQETISLIPETDSASPVHDTDSPKVVAGSSESKCGHMRRYSTGNIGFPYKSVKILSRYLAASTGSCHDNCKYGTRQILETKTPNSPIFGNRMDKQGREMGKSKTVAERKTKSAVSFMTSPGPKSPKPDFSVLTKSEVSTPAKRETVLLKQLSLPLKGTVQKSKPMLSKSSLGHSCNKEDGNELCDDKEKEILMVSSPGASSIKEMKTSVLDGRKVEARPAASLSALRTVKKALTQPIVSLSPKRSATKVSSIKTEKLNNLKVSNSKDHKKAGEAEAEVEQPSREDVLEKTLHVIESSAENKTVSPTQNSDFSVSPSSLSKDSSLKHAQVSSPLAHKILRRTQFGNRGSSRSPSSPDKKIILRQIIKGTRAIRSSISSLASSNYKRNGTFSEYHETGNEKSAANAKVNIKKSPRKGVVSTTDKGSPVKKLSFRKGKVLELCPAISSPRRLKFRKRLCESQIGKVQTTESKIMNAQIHIDDGEISVTKSEPEKVVLKHQDIEEKKAVQILLNNMIEETANKLAETKKSKVKALVGAFETVISLQDSRTSTADASSTVDAS